MANDAQQDDICKIADAVCKLINELSTAESTATHTRASVLSRLEYPEDMIRRMLGYNPGKTEPTLQRQMAGDVEPVAVPETVNDEDLPRAFDLRNRDGKNYVTSVKDQSFCSTCVAFAVASAIETQARLEKDIPVDAPNSATMPDLSEAQLFFCEDPDQRFPCFSGREIVPMLEFAKYTGVVPESCFPYPISSPFDITYHGCNEDDDSQSQITSISGFQTLTDSTHMKHWLVNNGAFVGGMMLPLDFLCYKSGVYVPSDAAWNIEVGGHCMVCVGYDDDMGAWLCKNCWGECWGDDGYIWLGYNQLGFDMPVFGITGMQTIYQIT